jgi:hypothetical protein
VVPELGVLLDLIRALLAAALVGIAPGWFWAKVLCTTADRVDRLTYSTALSVALVPSVALVQARLFGTGVTLAVTVISVLSVLASGFAVYLRFGPAKAPDEPLLSHPFSLDLPALTPLIAVFALVLGVLLGQVPGEQMLPLMAPLVFFGGLAHLLEVRRDTLPPQSREQASEPPSSPISSAVYWFLLSAVLLLVLLRSYPGPLRYDWPYPRGIDKWEHALMTSLTLSKGTTDSFMLYPPGFHFLAAAICRLSGLEPLKLFAVLAPALLLLPTLACYTFARRLWGWEVGVAAAALSGLVLNGSYHHVTQARYPNLIAAQFLLVLTVAALMELYSSSSARSGLLLALLGSSVVFYHQVASFYEAALLGLVATLLVPYLILHERKKGLALLYSLALLGFLSVLYAWDTYDLPHLVGGLLFGGPETGKGGEAVAMAIGTKPPLPLNVLLVTLSQPGLWLGLFGALLLLVDRGNRAGTPDALARITLLTWAVLMFAGTRTALSSFPDRFALDFSILLALLGALALITVLRSSLAGGFATVAAALLAALMIGSAVGLQVVQNIEEAAGPAQHRYAGAPTPEAVAAGRWLRKHNQGGNILTTPNVSGVPGRGILALGGYFGMQTYSTARIRKDRDLPPFGAGPLRDALWVLHHPAGKHTRRILEENDVRYVVLDKNTPTMNWHSFESRQDLYRMTYESKDVVIFAPREEPTGDRRPTLALS